MCHRPTLAARLMNPLLHAVITHAGICTLSLWTAVHRCSRTSPTTLPNLDRCAYAHMWRWETVAYAAWLEEKRDGASCLQCCRLPIIHWRAPKGYQYCGLIAMVSRSRVVFDIISDVQLSLSSLKTSRLFTTEMHKLSSCCTSSYRQVSIIPG